MNLVTSSQSYVYFEITFLFNFGLKLSVWERQKITMGFFDANFENLLYTYYGCQIIHQES